MIVTGLQSTSLDIAVLVDRIRDDSCGAVVVFEGVTRSDVERPVASLFYEAYEERAEQQLLSIATETVERRPIFGVLAVHRVGDVSTADPGVVVAVSSVHRDAAFDACREVIDRVKAECPIWKKECFVDGASQWVGVP